MKIFHLWIVFNSCVFMSIYFISFLLLKYSKKQSVITCIIAVILCMIFELIRMQDSFDAPWPKIAATIANILILQFTAIILSEKKNSYALFIGFSSSIFVLAGNISACAVLLAFRNAPAAMLSCTLINTAVLICMNKLIKDICINLLSREIAFWMCIVPAMCYTTFYLMLYFPVSFEHQPKIMYSAGTLLVTVVVLYVLLIQYNYVKSNEKSLIWRNKELHAYIKGIVVQTDSIQSAMQDFHVMRHDLRHKDHLLMELLHDKKYSEAEQVLQKDMEYLERTRLTIYCENTILNSLLCGMAKQAENLGILLHISCCVPNQYLISDYDLAIVTANLVENAIQAVQKSGPARNQIYFTLKTKEQEQFFLEIRNPCQEPVKFSKKTGLPVSSQGGDHGYGMMSVHEFIAKYHAHFDCYVENEIFIIRILIVFQTKTDSRP